MSFTAEKVTPVMYKIKGQMIPANLTLKQRIIFAQGLGLPQKMAEVIGMQDRAASIIGQLMSLIENADYFETQERAANLVSKWNSECDNYFASH
jgi:hypothetical protein